MPGGAAGWAVPCRAGGRSVQGAVLPLPVRRGRRQRLAGPITPEEEEEEAEGP